MEDTTFATFVVGAAFGLVLWYWLRRQSRKLGSDEDILPFIRPPSGAIGVIIAILVTALVVGALVYLSLILLGVPWIAGLGYWHDLVTREPIGYLFLGFLFGLLLGEWLSYIFLPPQLRTDALRDSHTRWGYFLVGILVVALLIPVVGPLLRTLSLKTPFGGVSFSVKEPEKGALILEAQRTAVPQGTINAAENQLYEPDRPLGELPFIKAIVGRDIFYEKLFLGDDLIFQNTLGGPKDAGIVLEKLTGMHNSEEPFVRLIQDFGKCVKEHWDLFHSVEMISQQIRPILPVHLGSIQHGDPPWVLKKAIGKAAQGLAYDVILAKSNSLGTPRDSGNSLDQIERDLESNTNPDTHCLGAKDAANSLPGDLPLNLPYSAFALSHLFYDAGDHEQAARIVADWLDAQYRHPDQLKICNDKDSRCLVHPIGYDAYPIGYKPVEKWEPLPIWYRIRMEYELATILERTNALQSIVDAYKQLEVSYQGLFAQSSIHSVEKWMADCGELKQHNEHKAQLILSYLTVVARRIEFQAAMIDSGRAQAKDLMTEQERADAEMLTKTRFDVCFPFESVVTKDDLDYYEGNFYAQYGTVLALSASVKDASWEIERVEQKRLLSEARLQLEKAVQTLEVRAKGEANDRSRQQYEDQLFYLGPAEEALRAARQRLKQVNQALR